MKEFVLHLFLPRHELHVVHQQKIRLPVLGPELAAPVGPDQFYKFVDEFVAFNIDDFGSGVVFPDDVGDGVEQMRLPQAGIPVDEERVVVLGRMFRHGHGSGVSQLVGRAHYEGVEGKLRVGEPLRLPFWRRAALEFQKARIVQNFYLKIRGKNVVEGGLDVVEEQGF